MHRAFGNRYHHILLHNFTKHGYSFIRSNTWTTLTSLCKTTMAKKSAFKEVIRNLPMVPNLRLARGTMPPNALSIEVTAPLSAGRHALSWS
jgi:hypothetical protein